MSTSNRKAALLFAAACALVAIALFMVPAWVIQPFRAQDEAMLRFALALRRIAPLATIVLLVIGLLSVIFARPRRWAVLGAAVIVLILMAAAVVVRVNYFELMFHPNPAPQFVAVRDAGVDDDDMVMVARLGGQARAYPVRIMAYHHLVNDTVGGVPIVPTY
jgi:Protein of unknown function (DUF3179)